MALHVHRRAHVEQVHNAQVTPEREVKRCETALLNDNRRRWIPSHARKAQSAWLGGAEAPFCRDGEGIDDWTQYRVLQIYIYTCQSLGSDGTRGDRGPSQYSLASQLIRLV